VAVQPARSEIKRFELGLAILVIMTCFAANSVITRFLVTTGSIQPGALTIIRFLSGFIALVILAKVKPATFFKTRASRKDFVPAAFLGLYAFSISFGYAFIPAAAGALIFYTFVVTTMSSLSVLRREEKISLRLVLGSVVGLLGVFIITFSKISPVNFLGAGLMALTGISWGLYSVTAKKYSSYFAYSYNTFFVFGAFCVLALVVSIPLSGTAIWTGIDLSAWALALYMGMISTALSYILWSKVIIKIKSSQAGVAQLIVPILTSVMAIFLLNEHLTTFLIFGGALVLTGIYLTVFRR